MLISCYTGSPLRGPIVILSVIRNLQQWEGSTSSFSFSLPPHVPGRKAKEGAVANRHHSARRQGGRRRARIRRLAATFVTRGECLSAYYMVRYNLEKNPHGARESHLALGREVRTAGSDSSKVWTPKIGNSQSNEIYYISFYCTLSHNIITTLYIMLLLYNEPRLKSSTFNFSFSNSAQKFVGCELGKRGQMSFFFFSRSRIFLMYGTLQT